MAAARLVNHLLYGIDNLDPVTLVRVAAGISMMVMLASLAPSLRAGFLDPAAILRKPEYEQESVDAQVAARE